MRKTPEDLPVEKQDLKKVGKWWQNILAEPQAKKITPIRYSYLQPLPSKLSPKYELADYYATTVLPKELKKKHKNVIMEQMEKTIMSPEDLYLSVQKIWRKQDYALDYFCINLCGAKEKDMAGFRNCLMDIMQDQKISQEKVIAICDNKILADSLSSDKLTFHYM